MSNINISSMSSNTFNTKISDIRLDKTLIGKEDKLFPDNYFTYNIHKAVKTDFHTVKKNPRKKIFVCCFKILESIPGKTFSKPFLQFLLYKYPETKSKLSNLCIFPFTLLKNNTLQQAGKELVKSIFNEVYKCLGYIENNNGVYLFYNIDEGISKIKRWNSTNDLWWVLVHEICNQKKLLYFPIHHSVYKLFYENRKLIYLKDKKNKVIETPCVGYFGTSHELLSYISALGMKSSAMRSYGPYYYFNNYNKAIRYGGWTTSLQKAKMFGNEVADDNGKYKQGGIIRYALFLKKPHVILYRKSSFQHDEAAKTKKGKYHSIENLDKPYFMEEREISKTKGKWTQTFDSLVIGDIKFKNMSGYFNLNTQYILKEPDQFTSLTTHLIDNKSLGANWDPMNNNYKIK